MRLIRPMVTIGALALCTTACSSGSTPSPQLSLSEAQTPADEVALARIAEKFYGATTPSGMQQAVEEAKKVSPTSATYHELAANWARFRTDDPANIMAHLLSTFRDPSYIDSQASLDMMSDLELGLEDREVVSETLLAVTENHPSYSIRAQATAWLTHDFWLHGKREQAKAMVRRIRNGFQWKVIGAWDNDQGKGFDEQLPPEQSIELSDRYEGAILDIGWRSIPEAPVGAELDLGAVMTPVRWTVAYALTAFEATKSGVAHLRLSTGAPFKVWVDGQLVFSARVVQTRSFDQFVIPIELAKGSHRLLVKSAQETGRWKLGVRLTNPNGRRSDFIRPLPSETEPNSTVRLLGPSSPAGLFRALAPTGGKGYGPLRWQAHLLMEAERMGLRKEALTISDALVQRAPTAIFTRYARAKTAWRYGERGKTSDFLQALSEDFGDELVFLHFQHARFLRQEGLQRKARSVLTRARETAPQAAVAPLARRWARQFAQQNWAEDRCEALEQAVELRPGWVSVLQELADCYEELRFIDKARDIHLRLAAAMPGHRWALQRLFRKARDDERFREAETFGGQLIAVAPHQAWPHIQMAEVYRRQRKWSLAQQSLEKARHINPDNPRPWRALAQLLYQSGQKPQAIDAWKASLVRDPDDDTIAHRLAWLAPEDEGPWRRDVPGEADIEMALRRRGTTASPGAHVLNLLDQEVSIVNADGSTSDIVTMVVQALDDTGRDDLTKVELRRGGRIRVLKAYALSPDGTRTQVSNIRSRTARFRNLLVGSTVVLQYQHDSKPVGYLSRHIARGWWFQTMGAHMARSRWILWMPKGNNLNEWINDPNSRVQKKDSVIGKYRRIEWFAKDVEALVMEPGMPTDQEVALNLLVSTVPDWSTFLEWEKALLTDAFRETTAISALAQRIVGDAKSPREKALSIHRWLMEEIRYQQDYEDHIAGVRPHAAPVVVERSYGDCKDKSVLFITLAKQVGLQAEFVLLRTRPRGPLLRKVPMQQFDHAIVYVPAQPGLDSGFFIDSTADALDLEALRQDDAGVEALVFDVDSKTHTWRTIAFRSVEENMQHVVTQLTMAPDGQAKGVLNIKAKGMMGSSLRRLARDRQAMEQTMQGLAARLYGGATTRSVETVETKDLTRPAHIRMDLVVPVFARKEGRAYRIRLPPVWNPRHVFQLEHRKHPLVLGVPQAMDWQTAVKIPRSLRTARVPKDISLKADCFEFQRTTKLEDATIQVNQRFESLCERISVEEYAEHRRQAEVMIRAIEEDVVVVPRPSHRKRKPQRNKRKLSNHLKSAQLEFRAHQNKAETAPL